MANLLEAVHEAEREVPWYIRAAPSRLIAATGFCLFSLLASIVLIRRMAGAFSGSPSVVGYMACLLIAGVTCCSLKVIAEWPPHRLDRRTGLIFGILIGLPLDVLAIALLPTNWSATGLVATLLWATLIGWFCLSSRSVDGLRYVVREVIWPEIERFLFPSEGTVAAAATSMKSSPVKSSPLANSSTVSPSATPSVPLGTVGFRELQGDLISELQRRVTVSGGDLLEGQLVAIFAAGSKQAVLHVPFIPPFAVVPHLECEIADESETRVKVAAVFPYGARLELKRNSPDLSELHVPLEIYAEATATAPAEAA